MHTLPHVDAHEVKDGGCMVLIQQIRHGDCGEVVESRLCLMPVVRVDRVLHATEYVSGVLSALVRDRVRVRVRVRVTVRVRVRVRVRSSGPRVRSSGLPGERMHTAAPTTMHARTFYLSSHSRRRSGAARAGVRERRSWSLGEVLCDRQRAMSKAKPNKVTVVENGAEQASPAPEGARGGV